MNIDLNDTMLLLSITMLRH